MQRLSVFDMFKIGVGPSSSHTMGPWRAALRFLSELPFPVRSVEAIQVELFGSLAKTGVGHGTDIAVQLGLMGTDPETIEVDSIPVRIQVVDESKRLQLDEETAIAFDPKEHIRFHFDKQLPEHPNGLRFSAVSERGESFESQYFSVGGGFVVGSNDTDQSSEHELPFPIDSAKDLLGHCAERSLGIAAVVLQNELTWRDERSVRDGLDRIKQTMFRCIHRGCVTEGVLPGGLDVHRRAPKMARRLLGKVCPADYQAWWESFQDQSLDFQRVLDWVSCFALAVNEENAAFGRVVTAPTNGAAGVIPAVLLYMLLFCDVDEDAFVPFLLVAGEIGCIFKKGATISAAMGGCQAEIGVSSAMAAAALTECLGGTPEQSTEAAEIAMEHHLGMTCDPIGGLVQIPCIERNAMGAVKAITASQMALQRDTSLVKVSLDAVIRTMWETAQDMNAKYKETSEGGLAIQIPVNVSEC